VSETIPSTDLAARAREAIEQVCTGVNPAAAGEYYDPGYVDHVNSLEYHGIDGIRESVALYQELFPDLRFTIETQIHEGDRVASLWVLHGTYRGKGVKLRGTTLSRFRDDKIVEDIGCTDTIEVARQLGVWRTILLAITHPRLVLGSGQKEKPTHTHG